MHFVIAQIRYFHGLEGARAYVQRDEVDLVISAQIRDHLAIKMQARGGCGDSALLAREDALIPARILFRIGALDIRWQRHVTDTFANFKNIVGV